MLLPEHETRLIDEVDAALQELSPERAPLTEAAKARIEESVCQAPPMTDQQCRRVGRLLRGSTAWPE